MKRNLLVGALSLVAVSLIAADPKDAVKDAAKKLADQPNYTWKTVVTTPAGGGGRFRPGPIEGKTEKGGATLLSMTGGDNTYEAVLKGGKGAIKVDSGWKSLAEAADEEGPVRFMSARLRNYKTPAAEAQDLADKTKELKDQDGVYSGDLTEDGAKQLLQFRGRQGNGPEVSGAKGSAKFWVKDGTLSKFEFTVQGTMSFNGNDREINRTTTVEIKDVGATKVAVPEEASKKIAD